MKRQKYLRLRGNTWGVVVPVPKDLQPVFSGKRVITRSLRTSDRSEAERKYYKFVDAIKTMFSLSLESKEENRSVQLSHDEVERIAFKYFQEQFSKVKREDINQYEGDEKEGFMEPIRVSWNALRHLPFEAHRGQLQRRADEFLIKEGYPGTMMPTRKDTRRFTSRPPALVERSVEWHRFVELVRKADIICLEEQLERLGDRFGPDGRFPMPDEFRVQPKVRLQVRDQKVSNINSPSVEEVIDDFMDWKRGRGIRDPKSISDIESTLSLMATIIGGKRPIVQVDRRDLLQLRAIIDRYPSDLPALSGPPSVLGLAVSV